MKLKVNVVLFGLDGKALYSIAPNPKVDPPIEGMEATLRKVLVDALMSIFPQEQIDGTEKYRRYNLARIITKFDEPEIRQPDITLLLELTAKAYGQIVYGPVRDILDPNEEKETVN